MSSAITGASSSSNNGQVASTAKPSGETADFNASTPVSDVGDLEAKAPKVYKAMMEGIATNIVNEMKEHQERLKEMSRQAQREAEGKS